MRQFNITQNTFFMTSASILQKVVAFVYFAFIARVVGVENTGIYFFAIAFSSIFTVIADFGLGPILTRETAKYPEKTEQYVNTLFLTKFLFSLSTYGLLVVSANLLGYGGALKLLIYVAGITMFFDSLQNTFYGVFRARKNLIFESIAVVGAQTITLIIGTLALLNGWPLVWLILAYTIPSFLNLSFGAFWLRRQYNIKYTFIWNKAIFRTFISLALPFALAGILARVYTYADSLIMSKLLDTASLGWWSVPYKITFAFQFIPVALSASVFPAMSAMTLVNKEKIGPLFEKAWRYLLIVALPLVGGLFVLAQPIIIKVFGQDYLPSVQVLRVLIFSLIFTFLAIITGALLNAVNKQRIQTTLLASALGANIVLNLILLPRMGVMGAAYSSLVGSIILCIGGYYYSSKFTTINHGNIFSILQRVFWPAAIMAVLANYLSSFFHFALVIPISGLTYLILVYLSKGLDRKLLAEQWKKINFRSN
jgi:O-antigen/teichoic acid export membrane protein